MNGKNIRIGQVVFDVGAPCSRCAMITVDPSTFQRSGTAEPLKTLSRFRKMEDGQVYFGVHLVPRNEGRIFTSDPVEILETKPKPVFIDVMPPPPLIIRANVLEGRGINTIPPPPRKLELTCVAVSSETPDIKTFRFHSNPPIGNYLAGQFVSIDVPLPGRAVTRSYTLSSSPSRPADVSISVKRLKDGAVSSWLHEELQPGARLNATVPLGHFYFPKRAGKKLLLLGAGSGMAPIISMFRWIADMHVPTDVVVHQSCRAAADLAFRAEMELLAASASVPVRVSSNFTGGRETGTRYLGRLTDAMLDKICPDIDERVVFCCGPDGFRRDIRNILNGRPHFAEANFIEEAFGSSNAPRTNSPLSRSPSAAKTVQIRFPSAKATATADTTSTLLEIIRGVALPISSSCQAGLCGSCKCQVVSGRWRLSPSNVDGNDERSTEEEKAAGFTLACSCCPTEHMVVELV